MNWDDLYRLFISMPSRGARRRVLGALADPEHKIIVNKFYGDGGGCLFAVAHAAALRTDFSALFASSEKAAAIASCLGITEQQVAEGVRLWDSGGKRPRWCISQRQWEKVADSRRTRFRERIRRHLESDLLEASSTAPVFRALRPQKNAVST